MSKVKPTCRVCFHRDVFELPTAWTPDNTASFLAEWQEQRARSPRLSPTLLLDSVQEHLTAKLGSLAHVRYVGHK